ncbi:hypothetical protein BYT27DRAFT_7192827, partial [Phlegmacium glaucopus]
TRTCMFSLSSNINFVSSSCSSSKSLRSSDTLGAGRHSTHAEANVLSAYCSGSVPSVPE